MSGLESDTIGGAIHHIGNIHKYARPEDVLEHMVFVVKIDGIENASHIYSSEEVKKMVERHKKKYGWEVLFIGANIDSVETAKGFGIGADRAVNYHVDSQGTEVVFNALSETVCNVRANKKLSAGWSDNINADYNRRKRR